MGGPKGLEGTGSNTATFFPVGPGRFCNGAEAVVSSLRYLSPPEPEEGKLLMLEPAKGSGWALSAGPLGLLTFKGLAQTGRIEATRMPDYVSWHKGALCAFKGLLMHLLYVDESGGGDANSSDEMFVLAAFQRLSASRIICL